MKECNIYLVRHSEIYNPNKLCFGQSEMPLEENFTVKFDWIKEQLILDENTAYYSSPLRRCTKLASYLSDDKFTTDDRILDLNYGAWEMKKWDEISSKELTNWKADFVNYKIKKGESFSELYERAVDFYEETIANCETQNMVIVTHASVIRSIASHILDFPLEKVFNLNADCNSISKLTYNKDLEVSSVVYFNLTSAASRIEKVASDE